jgi:hypothetical protein
VLSVRLAKSIAGVCARVRLPGPFTLCPLISIAITAAHSLIALLAGTSTSHLIAGLTAWPAGPTAIRAHGMAAPLITSPAPLQLAAPMASQLIDLPGSQWINCMAGHLSTPAPMELHAPAGWLVGWLAVPAVTLVRVQLTSAQARGRARVPTHARTHTRLFFLI